MKGHAKSDVQGASRSSAVSEDRDVENHRDLAFRTYERVVEAMPDPLLVFDADRGLLRCNEAARKIVLLGPEEELEGKRCFELFGHDSSCDDCPALEALRTKEPQETTRYFDVLARWFEIRAFPLLDEEGEVVHVVEHLRDITEQRRAARLEMHHGLDMAFLTKTAMSFVKFPPGGDLYRFIGEKLIEILGEHWIVSVAESLEDQRGFRPRAILGVGSMWPKLLSLLGLDPMGLVGDFNPALRKLMQSGAITEIEDGAIGVAGEALPAPLMRGVASLLRFESAYVAGFVCGEKLFGNVILIACKGHEPMRRSLLEAFIAQAGVAIEHHRVYERNEALEAQLAQSQKMEAVGRLAGGVAHDFNNLLTGITGNVALAEMEVEADHPVTELLGEIDEAATRAADLTRQLLAFSRRQILAPQRIDLNELIEKMHKMLRRLIGEDVRLIRDFEPDLPPLHVDPGQMEQIVVNLAVNARDAMPAGGELSLKTDLIVLDEDFCAEHPGMSPGSHVVLRVSDTGCGMDATTRERAFEPFFTTKPEGEGTGLGLSTVFGAVKQNGGHVTLESVVDEGTTFELFFPAVDEPAERVDSRTSRATEVVGGQETILVVEDEASVRELLTRLLSRYGYEVLSAAHGAAGLEVARNHAGVIELLLTDVIMPVMKGPELAERLLAVRPDMRVLYASGYADRYLVDVGELGPNMDFIAKPFSAAQLCRKVREILDR